MQLLPSAHMPITLPSPTLTNPDMILPHHSPSPQSSPSTQRRPQQLPSLSSNGNGHGRSASTPDDRVRMKGTMYSPFRNGVLRRYDDPAWVRSSTEVGAGRNKNEQSRFSYQPGEEEPIASSPTLHDEHNGQQQQSSEGKAEQDYGHAETRDSTYSTPSILDEDENDPHSHAAMTKRAEEILANAKKRLTNMEGNLNRARSTLSTRPSSSMSSFTNRSPEPVSLYTIPEKNRHPGGYSPSKHRQINMPPLEENKQGHYRVFSETSVPSSLHTTLPNGHTAQGTQANGLTTSGEDSATRERHSEPSRNWFWNGLTRNTSLNHSARQHNGLQPLNEDGPAPESFDRPEILQDDEIRDEKVSDHPCDQPSPKIGAFDEQNPPNTGLTRARSTTQMSDLRDQMQDLKGKISTLRRRAQEDNLRRRSLQSLRTPSPFTAAEQWYDDAPMAEENQPKDGSEPVEVKVAEDDRGLPNIQKEATRSPIAENNIEPSGLESQSETHKESQPVRTENAVEEPSEAGQAAEDSAIIEVKIDSNGQKPSKKERIVLIDDSEEAEGDEKEDSLYGDQDFHETSNGPIIERHEDRPDAFDYEHFILHSAMGSYSGVGVRRSSSHRSHLSTSSVETTKPRNSMDEPFKILPQDGVHGRQNSVDSVSTADTFATATEGKDSDETQVESDESSHQSTTESSQPDHSSKRKVNGNHLNVPQSSGPRKFRARMHISSAQKVAQNGTVSKAQFVENAASRQQPDLFSYLSTLATGEEDSAANAFQIGDWDKDVVEQLVKSLAKVCNELHRLGPQSSNYEARRCRRKLDSARRVLDGEMNGEVL